jgi:hypothetical protein
MGLTDQEWKDAYEFAKMRAYKNGLIVFFIDKGLGFVLNSPDNSREVGYYSEAFFMENYTDFNEPLTLQNQ